jgi:transposase
LTDIRSARWRSVGERTLAWLNQFRRLRIRYGKRANIHEAFLSLGLRADLLASACGGVRQLANEVCPGSASEADAKPLQ